MQEEDGGLTENEESAVVRCLSPYFPVPTVGAVLARDSICPSAVHPEIILVFLLVLEKAIWPTVIQLALLSST
jgi:hypothetical protein